MAAPQPGGTRSGWPTPSCAVRPRRAVVAGLEVGTQRCVGVRDLADHPDRRLRREPEPPLEIGVEAFLHLILAVHPLGTHHRRQPRRRLIARAQCGLQRRRLIPRRQDAHLDHLLHTPHANRQHRQPSATTRFLSAPIATVTACPAGNSCSTCGEGAALSTPFTRTWSSSPSTAAACSPTRCSPAARHHAARLRRFGAELREFNGETDHVHLLVHYPPNLALSVLVNRLKGVSSRRLRQQFPAHIRNTCAASTSGPRPISPAPAAAHP